MSFCSISQIVSKVDGGSGHLEAKSGHLSRYVLCLHLLSVREREHFCPVSGLRTSLLEDEKMNAYFGAAAFRNLC